MELPSVCILFTPQLLTLWSVYEHGTIVNTNEEATWVYHFSPCTYD
jgi:hypothetical protein